LILKVNGEPREIAEETTVAALLEALRAPVPGVAVAVNGEVVPRARHAMTALRPGDRVEVIRAVGGG
jgi:sulfur carrier protein